MATRNPYGSTAYITAEDVGAVKPHSWDNDAWGSPDASMVGDRVGDDTRQTNEVVRKNGITYVRVGDPTPYMGNDWSTSEKPIWDEQYGYLVKADDIKKRVRTGGWVKAGTMMPALFGAALGGVAALGAGAAGAGAAGAAGAEAGAVAGEAGAAGAGAGVADAGATALGTDALTLGETAAPWSTNPSVAALGGDVGGGGIGSTLTNAATSTPPGSGTALQRILGLSQEQGDYLSLAGTAGSSLLGVLGSNAQGDAYKDLADKYLALGAPQRALLDASYKPGFDIWKQPGNDKLLDTSWDQALRTLSANGGNPYGNPGGLTEAQKHISGTVGPQLLGQYRSGLLQGGNTGLSLAGTSDFAGAQSTGGLYDALGAGLASFTQPKNSWQDLVKQLQSSSLTLNKGGIT